MCIQQITTCSYLPFQTIWNEVETYYHWLKDLFWQAVGPLFSWTDHTVTSAGNTSSQEKVAAVAQRVIGSPRPLASQIVLEDPVSVDSKDKALEVQWNTEYRGILLRALPQMPDPEMQEFFSKVQITAWAGHPQSDLADVVDEFGTDELRAFWKRIRAEAPFVVILTREESKALELLQEAFTDCGIDQEIEKIDRRSLKHVIRKILELGNRWQVFDKVAEEAVRGDCVNEAVDAWMGLNGTSDRGILKGAMQDFMVFWKIEST